MHLRSPGPPKVLTIIVFLSACLAGRTPAGDPVHQVTTGDDLWADDDREAYAVEIVSDDEGSGTNASPPAVTFKILESLRGEAKAGEEIAAKWLPSPCATGLMREKTKFQKWQSAKLSSPAKGTRWLVINCALNAERPFRAIGRGRIEWTAANRDCVVKLTEGWRERLQKRAEEAKAHPAAVAKRKEEDAAVQEKVDVAAAAKKSGYIVVGRLSIDLLEVNLLSIKVDELIRGAGNPEGIIVLLPSDSDVHLTIEARAGDPVIAFLGDESRASDGALCLDPIGGINGILTSTPERLKKVREALGIKAPGK